MDDKYSSKAAQDVIATTDSYGGPVSDEELAEVYLAPSDPNVAPTHSPPAHESDERHDDNSIDRAGGGGETSQAEEPENPD